MKVAVACDGLVVAPYFVQSTSFMIYTVRYGVVVDSRNFIAIDQPIKQLAELLRSLGVDTVIVGRIDANKAAALEAAGLEVIRNAADDPLIAVREYLTSILVTIEE